MDTTPVHAGKVVLFDRATGQRLERWPVDARELLATGDYAASPPDTALAPDASAAPVVEPALSLTPEPRRGRRGR